MLPAHPAREADSLAVHGRARLAQQAQRVRIAAEVQADLLEDRVRVVLDEREALLVEDLERGELRVRNGMCSAWLARRAACRAARPPLRRGAISSI